MEARLQRRVQRYGWDRAASTYERHWSRQLEPAQRRLLEIAEIGRGETILDIACGTGIVSIPAARAVGPDGALAGTDLSQAMVDAAGAKALAENLENTRFSRMGAEDLHLEDGSFDAALCALGLMYVPDPIEALREMHRVTRHGGRAVAAVWGAGDRCGWSGIFPVVDARVNTEVCPLFFQLGTGEALAVAFRAAGFRDVRSERLTSRLVYKDDEDALGAAFIGGPVAMAYSRFDEDTREDAHRAYLATIAPYRDGRGYDLPGEFVVTRGERR